MITRSLPIQDSEGIVLIITADLVVDPPADYSFAPRSPSNGRASVIVARETRASAGI